MIMSVFHSIGLPIIQNARNTFKPEPFLEFMFRAKITSSTKVMAFQICLCIFTAVFQNYIFYYLLHCVL